MKPKVRAERRMVISVAQVIRIGQGVNNHDHGGLKRWNIAALCYA